MPPFGGLRGNIYGSSMARSISANLTFFASAYAVGADIGRNCGVRKGVGHFERKFQGKVGLPLQILASEK